MAFIDSSAEDVTGNRLRERESDTQQKAQGVEHGSAATRINPLYVGRLLYQLS